MNERIRVNAVTYVIAIRSLTGRFKHMPVSRRSTLALIGCGISLTAALVVGFSSSLTPVSQQGAAQPTISTQSPTPTISGPTVPEDAGTVLSLKTVRAITGSARIDVTSSDSVESDKGFEESGQRYATSIYAYPDRTNQYVEIRLYQGRDKYAALRDTSFELSTTDNGWQPVNPNSFARMSEVPQAFVDTRYADNGTTIRSLIFIFDSFTVKVETANLPLGILMKLGRAAANGMYELNPTSV